MAFIFTCATMKALLELAETLRLEEVKIAPNVILAGHRPVPVAPSGLKGKYSSLYSLCVITIYSDLRSDSFCRREPQKFESSIEELCTRTDMKGLRSSTHSPSVPNNSSGNDDNSVDRRMGKII